MSNPRAIAAGVLAMAAFLPASAAADSPQVAVAHLFSIGKTNSGTGNTAAPPIAANVVTVDNGYSINTTGTGAGFQKVGLYVSVLYENGSKSTGPNACLPAGKVPFGARVIGAWVPDGSTRRVLAPVSEIGQAYQGGQLSSWNQGTVSIRRVDLIKPPMLYANLQACGRVTTTPTATPAASNLFGGSLGTVFSLQSAATAVAIPPVTQQLPTPVNPIAPTLPVGQVPIVTLPTLPIKVPVTLP